LDQQGLAISYHMRRLLHRNYSIQQARGFAIHENLGIFPVLVEADLIKRVSITALMNYCRQGKSASVLPKAHPF
jgi:hypothetical protein